MMPHAAACHLQQLLPPAPALRERRADARLERLQAFFTPDRETVA
jgi:hypothetical protein